MIEGRTVAVIMPAYNAERTLEMTFSELPMDIVDHVILTDDASRDRTVQLAHELGIQTILRHDRNLGYGANQKTCYDMALELNADIIVMLHPDYQYTPHLITAMASAIAFQVWPVMFASRILGQGAIEGGMPRYKYLANRCLTSFQNILTGRKLSEYHTGFRAFSAKVLRTIDYHANSDDFIFDNEIISQIFLAGYEIGEISCPTRYAPESSSINFSRSVRYGLGVVRVSLLHFFRRFA